MRVWLDRDRLYALGLTTGDVVRALQGQNGQVASGVLKQPTVGQPRALQIAVRTLGRLVDPKEFADIVVKQSSTAVVRLKDVGRIELAAVDYSTNSYRDLDPAVALAIYQLPGSNALATAAKIKSTMDELSTKFPAGLEYTIIYNPTEFIQQSIDAVTETILEAIVLVVLVVILFLQTCRAAIIPIVSIPVSLIVSLTLSPAMCARLLKLHTCHQSDWWWVRPIHGFFRAFNLGFDNLGRGYGWLVAHVVRFAVLMIVLYAGVILFGLNEFRKTPIGFIPQVDQGYLIIVTQLPGGASLARTDEVNRRVAEIAFQVPGITHAVNLVGFSGATFTNAPNSGTVFVALEPFQKRAQDPRKSGPALQAAPLQKLSAIQEGLLLGIAPQPVRGIGSAGGFRMMAEDRAGRGPEALRAAGSAIFRRTAHTLVLT